MEQKVEKLCSVKDAYDYLECVYEAKNHDYGDSFRVSCDEFGLVAAVVRMNDKMNRVKSLYAKEGERMVEESLVDTLLDLANYAVMSAVWLNNRN